MLRGLGNGGISLIAGKIRDDFIEEIAFDFSFEESKGFKHTEVGKVITERNSKNNVSEMCLYRM